MLFEMPETHTVSTRLTLADYRAFRTLCTSSGVTMHKVVRLLVGRWMMEKALEYRTPVRISERLRRAIELERERGGGVYARPAEDSIAAKASSILAATERMFDEKAASLR